MARTEYMMNDEDGFTFRGATPEELAANMAAGKAARERALGKTPVVVEPDAGPSAQIAAREDDGVPWDAEKARADALAMVAATKARLATLKGY